MPIVHAMSENTPNPEDVFFAEKIRRVEELFLTKSGALRSYFAKMGAHTQDLEDLVQETFKILIRNCLKISDNENQSLGFLYKIAERVYMNHYRKEKTKNKYICKPYTDKEQPFPMDSKLCKDTAFNHLEKAEKFDFAGKPVKEWVDHFCTDMSKDDVEILYNIIDCKYNVSRMLRIHKNKTTRYKADKLWQEFKRRARAGNK